MRKRYKDIGFNRDVLFLFDLFNEQLQADLYLVGGAVRDILLNKEIKDYDFATNLTPEKSWISLNIVKKLKSSLQELNMEQLH